MISSVAMFLIANRGVLVVKVAVEMIIHLSLYPPY